MKSGIATDHGGFNMKSFLLVRWRETGHNVIDYGALAMVPDDDYPDYVIPLAQAVASCNIDRGLAIFSSGVGASICANKVKGVRACLIHDHYSAH